MPKRIRIKQKLCYYSSCLKQRTLALQCVSHSQHSLSMPPAEEHLLSHLLVTHLLCSLHLLPLPCHCLRFSTLITISGQLSLCLLLTCELHIGKELVQLTPGSPAGVCSRTSPPCCCTRRCVFFSLCRARGRRWSGCCGTVGQCWHPRAESRLEPWQLQFRSSSLLMRSVSVLQEECAAPVLGAECGRFFLSGGSPGAAGLPC